MVFGQQNETMDLFTYLRILVYPKINLQEIHIIYNIYMILNFEYVALRYQLMTNFDLLFEILLREDQNVNFSKYSY